MDYKSIKEVDLDKILFHFSRIDNRDSIDQNGLVAIAGGENEAVGDKDNKAIYFSVGAKGALKALDSWIRWEYARYIDKNEFLPDYSAGVIHEDVMQKIFEKVYADFKNRQYYEVNLKEGEDYAPIEQSYDFKKSHSRRQDNGKPYRSAQFKYGPYSNLTNDIQEDWNRNTIVGERTISPDRLRIIENSEGRSDGLSMLLEMYELKREELSDIDLSILEKFVEYAKERYRQDEHFKEGSEDYGRRPVDRESEAKYRQLNFGKNNSEHQGPKPGEYTVRTVRKSHLERIERFDSKLEHDKEEVVGRIQKLGKGQFATTYRVNNRAIKVFKENGDIAVTEDQIMSKANIPSDVVVFPKEALRDESGRFIGYSMDFVEGKTINSRDEEGNLSFAKADLDLIPGIVKQMKPDLDRLGQMGLVLSDCHESNIMISNNKIKIIDTDFFKMIDKPVEGLYEGVEQTIAGLIAGEMSRYMYQEGEQRIPFYDSHQFLFDENNQHRSIDGVIKAIKDTMQRDFGVEIKSLADAQDLLRKREEEKEDEFYLEEKARREYESMPAYKKIGKRLMDGITSIADKLQKNREDDSKKIEETTALSTKTKKPSLFKQIIDRLTNSKDNEEKVEEVAEAYKVDEPDFVEHVEIDHEKAIKESQMHDGEPSKDGPIEEK